MRVNINVKEVKVVCCVHVKKPNEKEDVAVHLKDYLKAEVNTQLLWATKIIKAFESTSKIHNTIQS